MKLKKPFYYTLTTDFFAQNQYLATAKLIVSKKRKKYSFHPHFNYEGFTSLFSSYYQNVSLICSICFTLLHPHARPFFILLHSLKLRIAVLKSFPKLPRKQLEYNTNISGTATFFPVFNSCSKTQTFASNGSLHGKILTLYSNTVRKTIFIGSP